MYPFTNETGKMKVSQAMTLLNWIAVDWNIDKLRCIPVEQKLFCWGHGDKIASRILKNSARNN